MKKRQDMHNLTPEYTLNSVYQNRRYVVRLFILIIP